jgi:hypothetical protein
MGEEVEAHLPLVPLILEQRPLHTTLRRLKHMTVDVVQFVFLVAHLTPWSHFAARTIGWGQLSATYALAESHSHIKNY